MPYRPHVTAITNKAEAPLLGVQRDERDGAATSERRTKLRPRRERELRVPDAKRVPLPPLPVGVLQARRRLERHYENQPKISGVNPPSVCLYTVLNAPRGVGAAAFSANLEAAAIGFADATIAWHALSEQSFVAVRNGTQLDDVAAAFDDEPATPPDQAALELLDETTRAESFVLRGHHGPIHSTSFGADTRLLLSASRDESVRLWSRELRRNLVTYRLDAAVWDAQLCCRGLYFAATTASGHVALFSTERQQPLRVLRGHGDDVTALDFHANCNYVLGASDDGAVYVWDLVSGTCVQTLADHPGAVHSLKVSPDGRTVATACSDGVLRVWDLGQPRHPLLTSHDLGALPLRVPLVFSPDGATLAVGAPAHALSLFNVHAAIYDTDGAHLSKRAK